MNVMAGPPPELPPRILLVMPQQWPRALLRAELRERGYDAAGARDLMEALSERKSAAGPVRLILIDQNALAQGDADLLHELVNRLPAHHPGAAVVLLAGTMHKEPEGPWQQVLRRPMSISDIVTAVQRAVPLPPGARHPLD
jgi:CheY-like chemotaxis protein